MNKMKARLRRAIQKQKMLPAKGSGGSSGGAGGAGYRSSVGAPPSGGGRGSGVAKFSDGVQLQGLNNEDMEYLVEMQNVIKVQCCVCNSLTLWTAAVAYWVVLLFCFCLCLWGSTEDSKRAGTDWRQE